KKEGRTEFKKESSKPLNASSRDFIDIRAFAPEVVDGIKETIHVRSNYGAFLAANNLDVITNIEMAPFQKEKIRSYHGLHSFEPKKMQARETLERYKTISELMNNYVRESKEIRKSYTFAI